MARTTHCRVLVLDLTKVVALIRSTANAQAMADTTALEWKSYNASTVLNLVYTVMFWKEKPGWVEVKTATQEAVLRRSDDIAKALWRGFFAKLDSGAPAITRALHAYDEVRGSSLERMRQQFATAQAINNEVIDVTRQGIRDLARIKAGSDLVVKVAAPPVISVPYSMTTTFIKELGHGSSANVVAFEMGKEPAKEAGKHLAEKGSHMLAKEANGYQTVLHNARVDIIRQNDLIRRRSATTKSIAKAELRLTNATDAAATASRGAGVSAAGASALRALKWGFVAFDVYETWHDYSETVGQ